MSVGERRECLNEMKACLRAWFGNSSGIAVRSIEGVCPLFPEEEAFLHRAVPRRVAEFSTGRWCAREALVDLGVPPAPILVGRWREPLWPAGIAGTISHSTEVCAAVVVSSEYLAGLGIDLLDADAGGRFPPDLAHFITTEEEEYSAQAVESAMVEPLALLFSAKESVIKAISARLQRFVDFPEIRVRFDGNRFEASLDTGHISVTGWWAVIDKLILTGAVLVRGDRSVESVVV